MSHFILYNLEGALVAERARIVGLCTTLTGNASVAEDLAQEVMLEAWRSVERLRDTERFSHWLSGIARNVCLRWMRKQERDRQHVIEPELEQDISLEELLAADIDVEFDLERKELIELLDRALALLPPTTRDVLVARYVEESSLAEVAERLGLQTSTVAMRLQRGKLALRRTLSNELGADAQAYGLLDTEELRETNIWCSNCGQHRLLGQFKPAEARLFLTCPQCGNQTDSQLMGTSEVHLFAGMKRIKPAVARIYGWIHRYYGSYLATLAAPCLRCGRMTPIQIISALKEVDVEHFYDAWQDKRGVYQNCYHCHLHNMTSLEGLVLALPEGQCFLQAHPRIRTLPEQQIEADGQSAFIARFESVTDQARFEVVTTSDTYRVLYINGRRS
jgi:RNA polymerase sigma factor (sigma-70 family)